MKKYIFEFTKKGRETFLSLPKAIRIRIEKKLRFFITSDNPFVFAKKLQDLDNIYRFRVGDYRVIFANVAQKTLIILLILKVAHRKDVYD